MEEDDCFDMLLALADEASPDQKGRGPSSARDTNLKPRGEQHGWKSQSPRKTFKFTTRQVQHSGLQGSSPPQPGRLHTHIPPAVSCRASSSLHKCKSEWPSAAQASSSAEYHKGQGCHRAMFAAQSKRQSPLLSLGHCPFFAIYCHCISISN